MEYIRIIIKIIINKQNNCFKCFTIDTRKVFVSLVLIFSEDKIVFKTVQRLLHFKVMEYCKHLRYIVIII